MDIYRPSDAYRINSVYCLPLLQIPFSRLPATPLLTVSKPHNESGQANLHGVCYACADAVYEFLSPIPVILFRHPSYRFDISYMPAKAAFPFLFVWQSN